LKDLVSRLKGTFFEGLLPLDRSRVPVEILAGCVMAAIFIPEVMGYARIAGMPVITGIYTLLLPMAVFAVFCSSRHLIVAADSATAAIIFGILITLAVPGSPEYTAMACTIAIMCALFLVIARALNLGFIGDFLSRTALIGFLTGVGIQVAVGQLAGMFGVSSQGTNTIGPLISFIANIPMASLLTIMVSVTVLAIILICRHISKKIPGALIAVIITIIASFLLDFSARGVSRIGTVPSGLPVLAIPAGYAPDLSALIAAAGACFIVIIAQSAATARTYKIKCSDELDQNKDIIGLGLANFAAGISGTFVVNGSPTKTQIALESGARSQMATLAAVVVVLAVILFLTGPLSYLPNATLASIVFLIGLEMLDIEGLRDIYHKMPSEFALALITLLTVVMVSVMWGIIVAIILSILLHVSHSYQPINSLLIRNARGEMIYSSVTPGSYTETGLIVYRFNRDLYYANADKLMTEALGIVKTAERPIEWFILDCGGFEAVDYTSIQVLQELRERLEKLNVVFVIAYVHPNLVKQFGQSGLIKNLGENNLFDNVYDAIQAFETRKR
jgi:sulfate permease, SulP family